MNKNGFIRNIIRRRYNYWRRNIGSFSCLRTERYDKSSKQSYSDMIESICHQIELFNECDIDENMPKDQFVNYTPLSHNGDWMGRVITKEGRVFRGIYEESTGAFGELWRSGIIQVLAQNGLIAETRITNYTSDEFPIIVEHEMVDISTSKSWSYSMIRDAAVSLCIIRIILMRFGYTLHDAHLNNLTFSRGRFVFVDLGSIKKNKPNEWDGFPKELVFAALYKLVFFLLGNSLNKREQVFDEYNNAIWINERYYDDATLEYYSALKMFKRHLFLVGRWKDLLNVYKIFDCYVVKPEIIYRTFRNRKFVLRSKYYANVVILKELIGEVLDTTKSICIFDSISENLAFNLDYKDKRITIISDNDYETDEFYKRIIMSDRPYNLAMRNIMYGIDDHTYRYCLSDVAIITNIIEKTKGFHFHKFTACLNAIRGICEKYAIISFSEEECKDYGIYHYIETGFEEIKQIKDDKTVYSLLRIL